MTIERYPRSARRFHAAVYILTLLLLASGYWLLTGHEGQGTPIAQLTGIPDVQLHVWLGWALVVVAALPLVFGLRGIAQFVRETLRYDRGDAGWLLRWPMGVFNGHFRRHEGHFDPGQRLANVAIVGLLLALIGSGVGLVLLHAGPLFAVLAWIHRAATILFSVVIAGHILIAVGVLPGYRGVWRSMHLGGHLPVAVARRVWPGWTERELAASSSASSSARPSVHPTPEEQADTQEDRAA